MSLSAMNSPLRPFTFLILPWFFVNFGGRCVSASVEKHPDYLGSAGGLTYFLDTSKYRTWIEAKDYCEEFLMNLAAITDSKHRAFLTKSVLSPTTKNEYVWTSGRTEVGYKKLVWHHKTTFKPEISILGALNEEIYQPSCLAYRHDQFSIYGCKERYYTLCEDVPSSKRHLINSNYN